VLKIGRPTGCSPGAGQGGVAGVEWPLTLCLISPQVAFPPQAFPRKAEVLA